MNIKLQIELWEKKLSWQDLDFFFSLDRNS